MDIENATLKEWLEFVKTGIATFGEDAVPKVKIEAEGSVGDFSFEVLLNISEAEWRDHREKGCMCPVGLILFSKR